MSDELDRAVDAVKAAHPEAATYGTIAPFLPQHLLSEFWEEGVGKYLAGLETGPCVCAGVEARPHLYGEHTDCGRADGELCEGEAPCDRCVTWRINQERRAKRKTQP